ncbi:DMP19 family protein [Herbivorax sp. ANBcel31]|uniref:DMP19 family protein n=1 Tax=Herbivorax sp. ANBcel31 TaxID=3069754 RepID=UPI0027B4F104|nr:DMP19 family protein [Herbivorax sp. ANBcel31]MDQ2087028.1 DMP19 family protein [Herbivorax sp. ANBcel31]
MIARREKIKKILNNKSGERAIFEIYQILSPVFYTNPNNLSRYEKNIVFIEELENEVNNGGFNQFFFNTAGDYTFEILKALNEIGSLKFSGILEKAIDVFPARDIPEEMELRREVLEQIEEKANPIWNELDMEFYKYEEDIHKLMVDYIIENIR